MATATVTLAELPVDTVEQIAADKVTYRGCGIGKYARYCRVKVHGTEYRITWEEKNQLEKKAQELVGPTLSKIPFKAPYRRSP